MSKTGGCELGLVLSDRLMVSVKGNGVDRNDLEALVTSFDLAKLESMKDPGIHQ
jgi:hypothetical protein